VTVWGVRVKRRVRRRRGGGEASYGACSRRDTAFPSPFPMCAAFSRQRVRLHRNCHFSHSSRACPEGALNPLRATTRTSSGNQTACFPSRPMQKKKILQATKHGHRNPRCKRGIGAPINALMACWVSIRQNGLLNSCAIANLRV
jgi:hypothetical protein